MRRATPIAACRGPPLPEWRRRSSSYSNYTTKGTFKSFPKRAARPAPLLRRVVERRAGEPQDVIAFLVLAKRDPFVGLNAGFVALCVNFVVTGFLSCSPVSAERIRRLTGVMRVGWRMLEDWTSWLRLRYPGRG